MFGKYRAITIGIIVSLAIFVILLILQGINAAILDLETRWLLVAGIPILIALIIGGYIYRFKGFGIELETRLQSPMGTSILQTTDALEQAPGLDKEAVGLLDSLTQEQLSRLQRLSFVSGRKNYYDPYAVREYIQRLYNLQFIEIRDKNGAFQFLIPITVFREEHGIKIEALDRLVESVSNATIDSDFAVEAEGEYVRTTDKLLEILPEIRDSKYGWLPVLTPNRRLAGVITKSSVEARIADEVVAVKKLW